jgi:phosphopantothenoylcysteine decarboxylase/phosphopantothenate--cysteine ligase
MDFEYTGRWRMLKNKTVVLGVTGSIAAYKAVDLASKLTQAGANVDVVMTKAAAEFIAPMSFRSITHRPVVTEMFDMSSEFSAEHVGLAERADIVVIAPATACIIAKLAAGISDDILSCTVLATTAPLLIAPSMNVNMYQNPITQDNLSKLRQRGFSVVGPASGTLACGDVGSGRLADVEQILAAIQQILGKSNDLAGKRIVVTAGGTREPIDPIRYISNRSSGKMGYALAEAARDRGASVVLITAPTALPAPLGMEVTRVESALQMREEVLKSVTRADALIMAAAVADYRPTIPLESKLKREAPTLQLELTKTPDILGEVKGSLLKIGFAAESENLVENARRKLDEKHLNLIAANDVTMPGSGFDVDTNKVTLLDREGNMERLPLLPKSEVAQRILDKVLELMSKTGGDSHDGR